MARPRKMTAIFNSKGEFFVGSVAEFMEQNPTIVRNNLYRKWGAHDLNGTHWRIGEPPIVTRHEDEVGCRTLRA